MALTLGADHVPAVSSLESITSELIEKWRDLWNQEKVHIGIKVARAPFDRWVESLGDSTRGFRVEYDGRCQNPILKFQPSYIQTGCAAVFYSWFVQVGDQAGTGGVDLRENGTFSVKVPDAHLVNDVSGKPIIALQVGFTEPLNELFEDGERLLFNGRVDAVILIKVHESNWRNHCRQEQESRFLSGLGKNQIRERLEEESFVDRVCQWHRENGDPLIGDFTTDMYFWSSGRLHPPAHPIWTFAWGLNVPEQPGLLRQDHLMILGGVFPLPLERLESELRKTTRREEKKRAIDLIKRYTAL